MSVSIAEAKSAYFFLLGREASYSEASLWLHIENPEKLRDIVLASDECQHLMHRKIPSLKQTQLPLSLQPIAIECEASPEAQQRLLRAMTETWTRLGAEEPHWSVLSDDRFKADVIESSRDEFFRSGANDVATVEAILARHQLAPGKLRRVVEYGCGVGRVTPHFAAAFDQVTGIDISASHLALAQQAVAKAQRPNVRLELARAPDFGMTEPFDLWCSYIVLQHNPPPIIAMVLRRMFAMLAPGGVAIFQVPTYVPGYKFDLEQYLAAPKKGEIEVHCFPQQTIFEMARAAGCTALEVREDQAMPYPWLSNNFVFQKA